MPYRTTAMARTREHRVKSAIPFRRSNCRHAAIHTLVADVPEHIHRQVRVRCLERGVLVRDYVLELLARDGIR